MKNILFILAVISFFSKSFSQKYTINDKKAIEFFEKALAYYNVGQLENSKTLATKAIERNKFFIEAYLLLADIYNEQNKTIEEIKILKKVIEINPEFNEKIYLLLAKALYKTDNFDECLKYLDIFLSKSHSHKDIVEAKKLKEKADFAKYAYSNPVPFEPIRLSDNVNTEYKDYWPSLTIDEKELYYTVALPTNQVTPWGSPIYQEDLFFSQKSINGTWQPAKKLGQEINTPDNEGSQSISANGQYLFFVACNREKDLGSCDIYFSTRTANGWSKAKNIGSPINTANWESNPASSADGRILFFSCEGRPDSRGGKDIYVSFKKNDNTWTIPKNLGDSINTPGNEIAPFLHPDGRTLYFSSDGWTGLGGMDIFVSYMKDDSTWTTPKNLGYPINTKSDDFGLIVNGTGEYAFFSSNREGSRDWDIYTFKLYDNIKPSPVIYLTGKIYDKKTLLPLLANIEIYNLDNNQLIYKANSNYWNGEYLACMPKTNRYAINVQSDNHLFYSEYFSLDTLKKIEKYYQLNIPLKQIETGASVCLKNIFYETDKYELKPESEIELNKLVDFLEKYPNIKIEISGHTDNVGSAEYNKILSTNRAKSVYDYLISKGISANRITYVGYGFSKPIAPNDTPEGRALNRRTEFKIISIK